MMIMVNIGMMLMMTTMRVIRMMIMTRTKMMTMICFLDSHVCGKREHMRLTRCGMRIMD